MRPGVAISSMVLVQMMEPLGRRLVMRLSSSSSGMVSVSPRAKARIFSPAVDILAAMPPRRTSMISKPLGLLVVSHSFRHTTRRVFSASAEAVIRGIQSQGADVVAKHLCAQGETTGGVNASAARIGPRELREIHLPVVQAAVEAGVSAVMAAYNEIDGIYCHANSRLLTKILREEYGFRGFVMSDGVAIDQLDAVTGDRTASGALALNAGVDMGLWDTGMQQLPEAVRRGLTDEAAIDRAAKRILTLKFRRGLFENPYVAETGNYRVFTQQAYPQALTLAEHSLVLLKNEKTLLPLKKECRIGLTGPNADALYNQLGDYTPPVLPENGITPRQGLEALGADVVYAGDFPMFGDGEPCIIERYPSCTCTAPRGSRLPGSGSSAALSRGGWSRRKAVCSPFQSRNEALFSGIPKNVR